MMAKGNYCSMAQKHTTDNKDPQMNNIVLNRPHKVLLLTLILSLSFACQIFRIVKIHIPHR